MYFLFERQISTLKVYHHKDNKYLPFLKKNLGGLCSEDVILFWITHPTTQLGALSKREVRYISTKLFSPFRGAFSYIPARLIAELRPINPMSSSSNQFHMQFFHNIWFLQHLCDTCHSGLTRGLKKQIFCDPFFLYCDPFFGYTFRPYINQNQMSFNSTIYTIWYMIVI